MVELRKARPRWAAVAFSVLVAGLALGIAVATFPGERAGSEAPAAPNNHVVRTVFTERSSSALAGGVNVAEGWILAGADGAALEFLGFYYDPDGNLQQAQHRTPGVERVYWGSSGGPRGAGFCVEEGPAHPRGLEAPVLSRRTEAQLEALGYRRGGEAGEAALQLVANADAGQPYARSEFSLDEATLWQSTETLDGFTRLRTLATDSTGLTIGFWSVLRNDATGENVASNSQVTSSVELYSADALQRVLEESVFANVSAC